VLNDLVAPSADVRDAFDDLHRLIDPSHRRAFLDGELVELLAEHLPVAHHDSAVARLPLDIALTDQSDRDAALAALRAELFHEGPATGFEPAEVDGSIIVAFPTTTVGAFHP